MRVPSAEDVFALGDCAGFLEQTGRPVLPALAQVRILIFPLQCLNCAKYGCYMLYIDFLHLDST